MISDTAEITGDRHTRAMIFFSLLFAVEFPRLREDFKFCHILYPARECPTHINIPQIRTTIYEIKYQNFLSAYKTTAVKIAVIASNTQMFCSRGAANDVLVVSSRIRSKMLNADRFKAIEKQSMSSDAVNVPIDTSCNSIGFQSSPTTFNVAAIRS